MVKPRKAAKRPVKRVLQHFGLPDAGLKPDVFDAEHVIFPVSHGFDPPDEAAAPEDGQGIVSVFSFADRRVDLP
jgi:hypothetical protein